MAYYIRVLSPSDRCIPFAELQASLASVKPAVSLIPDAGSQTEWEQIALSHSDGTEIAAVERDPVYEGSLAAEELEEFREQIADCQPTTAVSWLLEYFGRVRTIYAFQILSGTEAEGGWDAVHTLQQGIWRRAGGILQAGNEGFSNESGYHILWQFSDTASGPWSMGVLRDGSWVHFEMDLGDLRHRQAFLLGEVPPGVKLA